MRLNWGSVFKIVRLKPVLVGLSSLLLTCCASQGLTPPSALPAVQWQEYTAEEAKKFSATCQDDYHLAEQQFTSLEQGVVKPQLLDAINALDITLDRVASSASLYRNVHPDADVRKAADECQQNVAALWSKMALSRPIYEQLKALKLNELNQLDQRFATEMLEGFELSGVNKNKATRKKIAALNDEVIKIGQKFNQNIRDDVREVVVGPKELSGLPQDYIDAHPVGDDGKVVLTTRMPDYLPVVQYAHSDDLRRRMFEAYRNRAYPNNQEVLRSLLKARYELAQLVGYTNYADYVTQDKMIGSAKNAQDFIDKITRLAKPAAEADYQQLLTRLKKDNPNAKEVKDWQKSYLENAVKTEQFQVDAQAVREYFAYNNVRDGIFQLVERLFGVEIVPWQISTWHKSVETYQIIERGELVGQFYLDMHPREGKYSHAAAFGVREGVKGVQTPIAALVCNFPGGDGTQGLMEHSQVETFLHEFGHLLHGLFGGFQPRVMLSGINTERDFVEAPSQMLEEWVWDNQTLKSFAKNSKGEVIPDALIEKMQAARNVSKGWMTQYQMFYAALSLNIYTQDPTTLDFDQLTQSLQKQYAPFAYVPNTHFYTSFGHLYGYSAIYYTYMWSLVIAADMFSEFEKHGMNNTSVAARYRKAVLAAGGTKDAADLVEDFLGRPYEFDAFAKQLLKGTK